MKEFKNLKYCKITLYILGSIPSIFIISLSIFYIYYGIILGFWGISGIDPYKFPASKIYQYIILYSWIITFFSVPIFIMTVFYFIRNKYLELKKIVITTTIIFTIAVLLVFSDIFQFALD